MKVKLIGPTYRSWCTHGAWQTGEVRDVTDEVGGYLLSTHARWFEAAEKPPAKRKTKAKAKTKAPPAKAPPPVDDLDGF